MNKVYTLDIEMKSKDDGIRNTFVFSTKKKAVQAIFNYVGVERDVCTLRELSDQNKDLYWSIVEAPMDLQITKETAISNRIAVS